MKEENFPQSNLHSEIQKSFIRCVEDNKLLFLSIASSFTNCSDDDEEIVQQAFTDVWKYISKYSEGSNDGINLRAYIAKAVRFEGLKFQARNNKFHGSDMIDK